MKKLWSLVRSPVRAREWPLLLAAAAAAGAGTGLVSAAFLRLYEGVAFWPAVGGRAVLFGLTLGPVALVALPALGGFLCGTIADRVEPAVGGTGTPELLHSLRAGGAPVRARYAAWKTLASVFTTCTGGSAGPEAPMVTFGAGLAAWTGRRLKATAHAERVLTAAGGAAGFAAVFDAPLAGTAFALEVLLREVSPPAVAAVALAAVVGNAAAGRVLGAREFLAGAAAGARLGAPLELVFDAALGVAAALFGKAFIEASILVAKGFEKVDGRHAVRAAVGGLLVGLLGLAVPQALGNSHPDLPRLFVSTPLAWTALLAILAAKAVSCPLTVGSGGSGGIFIPYLLMGALLGRLGAPSAAVVPAAMVAGMAALFAAVTLAPATAGILALELTRNWDLALPVAVAVLVATETARAIEPESLDTRKLLKKGVRLRDLPRDWTVDSPAEPGS